MVSTVTKMLSLHFLLRIRCAVGGTLARRGGRRFPGFLESGIAPIFRQNLPIFLICCRNFQEKPTSRECPQRPSQSFQKTLVSFGLDR